MAEEIEEFTVYVNEEAVCVERLELNNLRRKTSLENKQVDDLCRESISENVREEDLNMQIEYENERIECESFVEKTDLEISINRDETSITQQTNNLLLKWSAESTELLFGPSVHLEHLSTPVQEIHNSINSTNQEQSRIVSRASQRSVIKNGPEIEPKNGLSAHETDKVIDSIKEVVAPELLAEKNGMEISVNADEISKTRRTNDVENIASVQNVQKPIIHANKIILIVVPTSVQPPTINKRARNRLGNVSDIHKTNRVIVLTNEEDAPQLSVKENDTEISPHIDSTDYDTNSMEFDTSVQNVQNLEKFTNKIKSKVIPATSLSPITSNSAENESENVLQQVRDIEKVVESTKECELLTEENNIEISSSADESSIKNGTRDVNCDASVQNDQNFTNKEKSKVVRASSCMPKRNSRYMFCCLACNTNFTRKDNLKRHNCGSMEKIMCGICKLHFKRNDGLKRHLKTQHNMVVQRKELAPKRVRGCSPDMATWDGYRCDTCDVRLATRAMYGSHLRSLKHLSTNLRVLDDGVEEITNSCLQYRMASFKITETQNSDIPRFLVNVKPKICKLIKNVIDSSLQNVTAQFEVFVRCEKPQDDEKEAELKSFRTKYTTIDVSNIEKICNNLTASLKTKCDEFQKKNYNWNLVSILHLEINIMKYTSLGVSSYMNLPKFIQNKKACINILNFKDFACLAWCLTAALRPTDSRCQRTNSYPHYSEVLNLEDIEFPAKLKDLKRIETLNGLSMNIFGLEYDSGTEKYTVVGPLYSTELKRIRHVNVLLLETEQTFHYVLIKNLSRLISAQHSKHQSAIYVCDGCLKVCSSPQILDRHQRLKCVKIAGN